ncbi:MAG TPA: MFS transporter, partial [Chloroflexota bacterium]|nr:MFS transporter [Chloroflexota bacterium]
MPTTTAPHAAGREGADVSLILAARGLRSFGYGLLAVLLGVALSRAGLSPAAVGALITVSLLGDFCSTYVVGQGADQWGRRRTLVALALLMAATGAVFGLTDRYPVLLFAAFFGTLGTSASETAPFLPIEQAILAQGCAPEARTALFARYNFVAWVAGAAGALAAGLPDLLTHAGLPMATGIRLLFGVYTVLALAVALLVLRLSPGVERGGAAARQDTRGWARLVPPLGRSRRIVLHLSALFSVDALSGGLTVQSLMVLYFHLRFGVPLASLAVLFFGANALSALSFLAAAPLARRFGLLNTMVFTHLPSNLLLALVAVMPTFPLAALVLLLRQTLSQMDVPTRQAYTMALVAPEERTAAASVTSLARSAGSATSPVFSGLLLQGSLLTYGIPFLVAGGLKVAYDLT